RRCAPGSARAFAHMPCQGGPREGYEYKRRCTVRVQQPLRLWHASLSLGGTLMLTTVTSHGAGGAGETPRQPPTLNPCPRQASLTVARYAVVTLILLGFVTTAMGDVHGSFTTALPPVQDAGWDASPSL